jgi:hypothetical protein
MFTIQEFIKNKNYNIENLYIDKFWNLLVKINGFILMIIVRMDGIWYSTKKNYIKILINNFIEINDYRYLNNKELNDFGSVAYTTDPKIDINLKYNSKHIIVTSKCFKKSLMLIKTDKANKVRDYYIELEDIFKDYLKYQNEYQKLLYKEENYGFIWSTIINEKYNNYELNNLHF